MRVLLYTGAPEWSATSRALLVGARGLAGRDHTVTVACSPGSRLEMLARDAGLETVAVEIGWFGAPGASGLRKMLQAKFIEVAIVSSERDQRTVAAAMRSIDRGAVLRRIAPFDGIEPAQSKSFSLKTAAVGLLVSSEAERAAASQTGWSIPMSVAPVGVDAATYDGIEPVSRGDLGAPPEGMLIACAYDGSEAGRLRMAGVFRALALVAPRHARLHAVVFGPGSADDGLRMHASALGVGRVISFLGDRTDARRVMRAADAGWVVAGGDAGAFACLDFMAMRIPVLAERWPLPEHFVADGATGVLLAPDEPSHMASAVAAFLTSDEKRVAMGNAARARVVQDFSETAMIDGFDSAVKAAGDRTAWQTT